MAYAPVTGYSDVEKGGGWLLFTVDILMIHGLLASGGRRGRSV